MKKLLAILIALILALGIYTPAFAEMELPDEPHPAMPVIIVQPVGGQVNLNENYKLSVEAHIPNGDEIGYRWYCNGEPMGQQAREWTSYRTRTTADYHVVVYNRTNPEYSVTSETVRVEVYRTLEERMTDIMWNSWGWLIFLAYAGPIIFIIAPLYMLFTSPVVIARLIAELIHWIFE